MVAVHYIKRKYVQIRSLKNIHVVCLMLLTVIFSILASYALTKVMNYRRLYVKYLHSKPVLCRKPTVDGNTTKSIFHSRSYTHALLTAKSRAIATFFASDDFKPALEVFLYSFNLTVSEYPLIFAIPTPSCMDDYSYDPRDDHHVLAQTLHATMLKYPNIPYNIYSWPLVMAPIRTTPRWRKNYSKLHLWEMTEYDQILFIDLDVVFLSNVDEIVKSHIPDNFVGTYDYGKFSNLDSKKMNGGVFLMKPSLQVYSDLLHLMFDHSDEYLVREAEQGLFNSYFNKSTHCCLPYTYNTQKTVSNYLPSLWDVNKLKILHYTGEKPWNNWAPVQDREKKLSSEQLREYKRKDSWDAHDYVQLHNVWKILYFVSRSSEFQRLNLYILPSNEISFCKPVRTLINSDFVKASTSWNNEIALEHTENLLSSSSGMPAISLASLKENLDGMSLDWKLYAMFAFNKVYYLSDSAPQFDKHLSSLGMNSENLKTVIPLEFRLNDTVLQVLSKLSSQSTSSIPKPRKSYSKFVRIMPFQDLIPVSKESRRHRESSHLLGDDKLGTNKVSLYSSRRLTSLGVKYMAMVRLEDLIKMPEEALSWTKVQLQDSKYSKRRQARIFFWERLRYYEFYSETDYYQISPFYRSQLPNSRYFLRSESISSNLQSSVFWRSLAEHLNFDLPVILPRRNSQPLSYPANIRNFIMSSNLFELFLKDLNEVAISIVSGCNRDLAKANANFTVEESLENGRKCLCLMPNDYTLDISEHINLLLFALTDLNSKSVFKPKSAYMYLNSREENTIKAREIEQCFLHVIKVYWILWLNAHNVEFVYSGEYLPEVSVDYIRR